MKNDPYSNIPKEAVSFALGVIETKLAEIARDFNQPEQEFREWVGILLLSQRQGISNSLSSLSRKTSRLYQAMGEMEVDEQSHRKTRGTHPSRKVANKKGFSYNGTHWTQQPKNKARVAKLAKARVAKLMAKVKKIA